VSWIQVPRERWDPAILRLVDRVDNGHYCQACDELQPQLYFCWHRVQFVFCRLATTVRFKPCPSILTNSGIDDPRRDFLIRSLSLGLSAGPNLANLFQSSHALGEVAEKLPDGRSIYKLQGQVIVDGQLADINTRIVASADPDVSIDLKTKYHDEPYYLLPAAASNGKLIVPAPVINRTDVELSLIEELVGRKPPFDAPGGGYQLKRERNY